MIGIITHRGDKHGKAVYDEIKKRGAEVYLIDIGRFPMTASSTYYSGNQYKAVYDGLDLTKLKTVWLRRYGVRYDTTLEYELRYWCQQQSQAYLAGIAQMLTGVCWYNPIGPSILMDSGYGKIEQIQQAIHAGLRVPKTCVTSEPSDAKRFVEETGKVIAKPLLSTSGHESYTMQVGPDANFNLLRRAPTILQEEIPKHREIRALLVGYNGMATEIDSQRSSKSKVDFRKDITVPHRPHALPDDVWHKLRELHARLGLRFGVHDLILTPEGEYVFLEVNQQGEFLWLQERTGQDYTGLVAAELISPTY